VHDESYTKEHVAEELAYLVKVGLLDITIREDGEWLYFPSEYSKTLTEDQLIALLDNKPEDESIV
jgi:hypothetical protein